MYKFLKPLCFIICAVDCSVTDVEMK